MPLNKSQKLKAIITKTNKFMTNQYPEDWAIIKYFIKTINNPFVLWHYYKKILLALRVPIIEEPIEKDIYIDDILQNDHLTDEEKEEDIEFRKEYYKEATIWFHRSKYGENTGISSDTLRKIEDNVYPLKDFGYDNMEELKNAEIGEIKVVKSVENLSSCSDIVKLDCKYLEKDLYKRYEPIGSVNQNQPGQIYLPHTDIKKILKIQGRNSRRAKQLLVLLEILEFYCDTINGKIGCSLNVDLSIFDESDDKCTDYECYVYVITSDRDRKDNLYKIGVAKDIKRRLKQLQTGNPAQLYYLKSFLTKKPYQIEGKIHGMFDEHRCVGEWFELIDIEERLETIEKLTN